MRKVPEAGELQHGEVVFVGEGTHLFHFAAASFDPAGRAKDAMVLLAEGMAGFYVVMEKAPRSRLRE